MRRYELMLLFRPDLEDDKLQSAVEKVTRAIVNAGGALTKVSPWGKRRLAYDIQHFREASYFLLHFDIAPSQIRELERGLLISEEVLRHLVTVLEDRGELSEEDLPPAAVPAAEREAIADEPGESARPAGDATDEGTAEADEQPAAEAPAESPAAESPAEESPAEESPAEESPAEESPAEEATAEETPSTEPVGA